MLIKATRLRPGVPLQVYIAGMVVTEAAVDGIVVVELEVVMGGWIKVVVITELTI